MRRIAAIILLVLLATCDTGTGPIACCRVCTKGKACGDSCIAREKQCTKLSGCACNGAGPQVVLGGQSGLPMGCASSPSPTDHGDDLGDDDGRDEDTAV